MTKIQPYDTLFINRSRAAAQENYTILRERCGFGRQGQSRLDDLVLRVAQRIESVEPLPEDRQMITRYQACLMSLFGGNQKDITFEAFMVADDVKEMLIEYGREDLRKVVLVSDFPPGLPTLKAMPVEDSGILRYMTACLLLGDSAAARAIRHINENIPVDLFAERMGETKATAFAENAMAPMQEVIAQCIRNAAFRKVKQDTSLPHQAFRIFEPDEYNDDLRKQMNNLPISYIDFDR